MASGPQISLRELAAGKPASFAPAPYWWDAAPPDAGPWPEPPERTDVLIVGAGFTGLSAALVLARAGRRTLVVDAGVPGFGASTRNGGQVGSGNQKFRVRDLIAMKGERKAVALLREGVAMLDGIEALIAEEKIDCGFTRCGRFRGAARPAHYDAMAQDMEDLARHAGVDFEMVPRAAQSREIGTGVFHGGSLLPMDASLHPGRYHAGLMRRVTEAGAVVRGDTAVRGVSAEADHFRVRISGAEIRARDVLIATNGYTQGVGAHFDRRIVPVVSAQIATGPIPQALFDRATPTRRVYGESNRVFYYFRPAPGENRLIWGGRASHLARENSSAAYRHLARDLLRVFPYLEDVAVTHGWTGRIGYTFDEFPHLGRSPEGVHYAMGYCGTGVSRATHFGRKIALQMLGRPEGRSAFDDIAFPTHPLRMFAKAAVPMVELWRRGRDATGL